MNIEDVNVGDRVWSYNEETGAIGLKKVLQTMQNEAEITLKLKIDNEIIETTTEHPFHTQDGWKDAADLTLSDTLQSKDGIKKSVDLIEYNYLKKKVFNFAVEDWHTYFVGLRAWLVHNSCWRDTFFKVFSKLKKVASKLEIHHRIPREWFRKGVFRGEADGLSNLIGLGKKFHRKVVNSEWKKFRNFYKKIEKRLPTQAEVYKKAKEIDTLIYEHLRKRGF